MENIVQNMAIGVHFMLTYFELAHVGKPTSCKMLKNEITFLMIKNEVILEVFSCQK